MSKLDNLVRSKGYKNFMAKLYGIGAAIVILGAMFKIMHWPGADLMIVVGGKNSSNTIELFNNIKQICPAIHIENIYDYKQAINQSKLSLSKNIKIGITAGASTDKQELIVLKELLETDINNL